MYSKEDLEEIQWMIDNYVSLEDTFRRKLFGKLKAECDGYIQTDVRDDVLRVRIKQGDWTFECFENNFYAKCSLGELTPLTYGDQVIRKYQNFIKRMQERSNYSKK